MSSIPDPITTDHSQSTSSIITPEQLLKLKCIHTPPYNKYLLIKYPSNIKIEDMIDIICKSKHDISVEYSSILVKYVDATEISIKFIGKSFGCQKISKIFCADINKIKTILDLMKFDLTQRTQIIILQQGHLPPSMLPQVIPLNPDFTRKPQIIKPQIIKPPPITFDWTQRSTAHTDWEPDDLGTHKYEFDPTPKGSLNINRSNTKLKFYQHLCYNSYHKAFEYISPEELRFEDQYCETSEQTAMIPQEFIHVAHQLWIHPDFHTKLTEEWNKIAVTSHIEFEKDLHETGGGQDHFESINFVDDSETTGNKTFPPRIIELKHGILIELDLIKCGDQLLPNTE